MAKPQQPSAVKLLMGVIFSSEDILNRAKKKLVRKFGPIDFQSLITPFNLTSYYESEMGGGLKRQFLSLQGLISPQKLPRIKLYTNRLEKHLSQGKLGLSQKISPSASLGTNSEFIEGRSRTINLDPGYLCASKLVLASCKNYSHRIYLGKGVYAEVTLYFRNGTFNPWPWTYPDYKTEEYIQTFNRIRQIYLKQLPDKKGT